MTSELQAALAAVEALLSAMETCHICQGILCLDDSPAHCENCSWDCDEHDEPECVPLSARHNAARTALLTIHAALEKATCKPSLQVEPDQAPAPVTALSEYLATQKPLPPVHGAICPTCGGAGIVMDEPPDPVRAWLLEEVKLDGAVDPYIVFDSDESMIVVDGGGQCWDITLQRRNASATDPAREAVRKCAEIARDAERYGACAHCAIQQEYPLCFTEGKDA